MTILQPSSNITDSAATQGAAKSYLANTRQFVADLLGGDSSDKVGALMSLGALLNSSLPKSGAYTVVPADRGKVIACTGTFTLGIDAAIALGDGFAFGVFNYGTGTITIDPYLSDPIDDALTKTLAPGKLAIVYCDGTRFATVGSIATGPGSGLDADTLDGQHGSYYAPASGGAYAPTTAFVNASTYQTACNEVMGNYTSMALRLTRANGSYIDVIVTPQYMYCGSSN